MRDGRECSDQLQTRAVLQSCSAVQGYHPPCPPPFLCFFTLLALPSEKSLPSNTTCYNAHIHPTSLCSPPASNPARRAPRQAPRALSHNHPSPLPLFSAAALALSPALSPLLRPPLLCPRPFSASSTTPTLWFVLRLSTCFLNTAVQKSLHRNLITSSVSPRRGRSLVYLGWERCVRVVGMKGWWAQATH